MIKNSLHAFVDKVLDTGRITDEDVATMHRDLFADGLVSREEVDVLVALDRAIPDLAPGWAAVLTALVVDFVVWTSRPTGYVDADTARWLVTTLSCGGGPTETAMKLAFEVIREAQEVDETLITFVMRHPARLQASAARSRVIGADLAA
jgi:hypothetical protein